MFLFMLKNVNWISINFRNILMSYQIKGQNCQARRQFFETLSSSFTDCGFPHWHLTSRIHSAHVCEKAYMIYYDNWDFLKAVYVDKVVCLIKTEHSVVYNMICFMGSDYPLNWDMFHGFRSLCTFLAPSQLRYVSWVQITPKLWAHLHMFSKECTFCDRTPKWVAIVQPSHMGETMDE